MRTVLLGAGAPAATLGYDIAPTSEKFGKTLNAKFPLWHDQYPFLRSAVAYLQKQQANVSEKAWPLHVVWNGIDENYKSAAIIENVDFEWPSHVPSGKRLYRHYQNRSWRSF